MKLRMVMLLLLALLSVHLIQAQTDFQEQLDNFVAEIAPADGPAISARITMGDETIAAAGGLVDVTGSEAASPEDRFLIASMSKTWLAVIIMQLAEQGVLTLDDPIANWLPPNLIAPLANADTATIYQLLTMTSGIPEYVSDIYFDTAAADPAHLWTAAEVLGFGYDVPPTFAPGEGFEYANTNYILLQLIAEAATSQPMHELMQAQIFEPLGLRDTCVQAQQECGEFVHGYEDLDGDGIAEDVSDFSTGIGLGDRALISTTADLTRFYQALFVTGELLSEESVQMMVDAGQNENQYGIGLEVVTGEYGLMLGHTGAVPGYTGAVYYVPDLDATVVMLYGSTASNPEHISALMAIAASAVGTDSEEAEEED